MSSLPSLIPVLLVLCIVPFGMGLAYGEMFAITLDNQCKTFIKNNLTSPCPSYELIDMIYPNTHCNFSGSGCVEYFRQLGGFHYLIDPEAAVVERVKTIEIRYSFGEYHLPGEDGYNVENHTINYGIGRYVDDKCKNAYIDSESWLRYLGDTVYYMLHDCDENYTTLNEYRVDQLNKTEHDIATSYKWQLEQWIKESREKCITKCFEY